KSKRYARTKNSPGSSEGVVPMHRLLRQDVVERVAQLFGRNVTQRFATAVELLGHTNYRLAHDAVRLFRTPCKHEILRPSQPRVAVVAIEREPEQCGGLAGLRLGLGKAVFGHVGDAVG